MKETQSSDNYLELSELTVTLFVMRNIFDTHIIKHLTSINERISKCEKHTVNII